MPKSSKINAFSDSIFLIRRTLFRVFHFKLSENYPANPSSVFQNPQVRPYKSSFSSFFPVFPCFSESFIVSYANSVEIIFFRPNTGRIPFLFFDFYQKKNDRIVGEFPTIPVVFYILLIPADRHPSDERWILPGSWLP